MSLQCFKYPSLKENQLATSLKIAGTIIPIGIALRRHIPLPLGSMVMLSAGLLAITSRTELRTLAGALLSGLPGGDEQYSSGRQPPTHLPLANSLWLNCGYRISVHY